jgi:hypothetical protein
MTRKTKGIRLLTEGPTGIYSSLNDISLWLRAYQAGNIVSKSAAELMTTLPIQALFSITVIVMASVRLFAG